MCVCVVVARLDHRLSPHAQLRLATASLTSGVGPASAGVRHSQALDCLSVLRGAQQSSNVPRVLGLSTGDYGPDMDAPMAFDGNDWLDVRSRFVDRCYTHGLSYPSLAGGVRSRPDLFLLSRGGTGPSLRALSHGLVGDTRVLGPDEREKLREGLVDLDVRLRHPQGREGFLWPTLHQGQLVAIERSEQ